MSPKTAHSIGERFQLQPWAALNAPVSLSSKGSSPLEREKTVDESLKKELTKILLEVYMSGGYVSYQII